MGCINKITPKTQINVITSTKLTQDIKETNIIQKEDQIKLYSKKNNEELNRQTSISQSQNIEHLIDNNPLPFVKIIKKKNK